MIISESDNDEYTYNIKYDICVYILRYFWNCIPTSLLFRRKEIYIKKYVKQGNACERIFNIISTLKSDVINVANCKQ